MLDLKKLERQLDEALAKEKPYYEVLMNTFKERGFSKEIHCKTPDNSIWFRFTLNGFDKEINLEIYPEHNDDGIEALLHIEGHSPSYFGTFEEMINKIKELI